MVYSTLKYPLTLHFDGSIDNATFQGILKIAKQKLRESTWQVDTDILMQVLFQILPL